MFTCNKLRFLRIIFQELKIFFDLGVELKLKLKNMHEILGRLRKVNLVLFIFITQKYSERGIIKSPYRLHHHLNFNIMTLMKIDITNTILFLKERCLNILNVLPNF